MSADTVAGSSVQSGTGGTVDVEFVQDIAILHMNRGENRVNEDFIQMMNDALDKVEKNENIRALITTGSGKFYSNGLDLAWMNYVSAHEKNGADRLATMRMGYQNLKWRIVTFPVVTVAALNGHTFAAGGNLSLAHDYRVMKVERGWWCMNEVITGVRFWDIPPLMKLKLESDTLLEAGVIGKRYPAEAALRHGIVDRVCPGEELLQQATAVARQTIDRGLPSRHNLHAMKCRIYGDFLKSRM